MGALLSLETSDIVDSTRRRTADEPGMAAMAAAPALRDHMIRSEAGG
jgi:hypothetical protein